MDNRIPDSAQAQPDDITESRASQAQQIPLSNDGTSQTQQNGKIKRGQWFVFLIVIGGSLAVVFGVNTSNNFVHIIIGLVSALALSAGIFQFSPYLQEPGETVIKRIGTLIDEGLDWRSRPRVRSHASQQTPLASKLSSKKIFQDWRLAWAIASTALVVVLLAIELLPIIPHLPKYCGDFSDWRTWPTISYPAPTQEPVGISSSEACFDFEKQNNNEHNIEQLIYSENQQYVPDTSKPHITLVVAASLTGTDSSSIAVGDVVLQGALIEQKAYNEMAAQKQLRPLRLLVANDGSNGQYANELAKDIVKLAAIDKTILGVVGWPFSTLPTETALTTLEQAHIVSISPTLSSNDFTGVYSYFFHIASPDLLQGTNGALFAETQWKPKKVVVFVDYGNPYSRSLATSFAAALQVKGVKVYFVKYLRDEDQAVVPGLVQKALTYTPDLIYFSGYANDFDPIRGKLSDVSSTVPVMGGDGLYELGGYQQNDSNFQGIYFTTFASTYITIDKKTKKKTVEPQPFSTYYSDTFDPLHLYPSGIDHAIAESDAILAYDATNVFLTAYLHSDQANPSSEAIYQVLQTMNDDGNEKGAIQGASGRISFGADGTPENKVILVLYADANHNTCIAAVYGTYQEDATSQVGPKPDCTTNDTVNP